MKKVLNNGAHLSGLGAGPVGLGGNFAGLGDFEWLNANLEALMAAAPCPPHGGGENVGGQRERKIVVLQPSRFKLIHIFLWEKLINRLDFYIIPGNPKSIQCALQSKVCHHGYPLNSYLLKVTFPVVSMVIPAYTFFFTFLRS